MSQFTQELRELSDSFKSETEVAVELLKQAGVPEEQAIAEVNQMEMEKAAVEHLAMSGIDIDSAVALVKAAGVNVKDLVGSTEVASVQPEAELFTKMAEYMESLEAQVEALTKQASIKVEPQVVYVQPETEPELPEAFTKAASNGFISKEELAQLSTINPETLTKLASSMEQPWEMGSPSGYARPKTDPLLEFLVG